MCEQQIFNLIIICLQVTSWFIFNLSGHDQNIKHAGNYVGQAWRPGHTAGIEMQNDVYTGTVILKQETKFWLLEAVGVLTQLSLIC